MSQDSGSCNSIRVDHLSVDYTSPDGRFRALDKLDLDIAGGSGLAFMGPSGCGKSTLLCMVAGLSVPTEGSVTIGESRLSAYSEADRAAFRKHAIGVVYQSDNLLPFLTVTENIRLQLALCRDTDNAELRTEELLERLGLAELGPRLPDQLSGGQRQRASIARAIIHRPAVMLADEPTGALDEENAAGVIRLLLNAQRYSRATLVVVTHDPSVAKQMDRLVELNNGSIIENGSSVNRVC